MQILAGGPFQLAENPRWHPIRQTVWWTDIADGTLWECSLDNPEPACRYRGEPVGGFSIERDGSLALFRRDDIVHFLPDTGFCSERIPFHDSGSLRFNDVCAMPDGTVLAGTIGSDEESGGVWVVARGLPPRSLWRGTRVSNGMAVSPDRRHLYWTDTTHRKIVRLVLSAGAVSPDAAATLFQFENTDTARPDGLALDSSGNLWSAQWDGAEIVVIAPDATLLRRIPLEVPCPTALCFVPGGRIVITGSLHGERSLGQSPVVVKEVGIEGAPVFLSQIFASCSASVPETHPKHD